MSSHRFAVLAKAASRRRPARPRRPGPVATLARVLRWDVPRLLAALTDLESHALASGLRVHRQQDRVSLVRDDTALPNAGLQSVLRYETTRNGLNDAQARLVVEALERWMGGAPGVGGHHMLIRGNNVRVAAAALVGAGVLTGDENGDVMLTRDAAVSLLAPAMEVRR